MIIKAKDNGNQIPDIELNLPPGYLDVKPNFNCL